MKFCAGKGDEVQLDISITCFTFIFFPFVAAIVWVVFCILVMIYNIGIPNKFKGFLFYVQVIYLNEYT